MKRLIDTNRLTGRGFTLIELMLVVLIASVLLVLAAPGMSSFFDSQRLKSAGEQVYSDLQLARSEAIARKSDVYFKVDASTDWVYAISDTLDGANDPDCALAVTDPNDPTACTLVVDDGDLVVHGIDGNVDVDDKVLQLHSRTDHGNITLSIDSFLDKVGNVGKIVFDPVNGTAIGSSGNILLTSPMGKLLLVKVSPLGQIRLCTPNESVVGYVDGVSGNDADC
jgi:type IV fimbrial biogenesis protein FimT